VSIEEVKVPVLAESVADATLLKWHKQPGEAVREGETLVEIETDKVVLDVVAPQSGALSDIVKVDGESVISEEIIAHIDTSVVVKEAPKPVSVSTATAKTSPAVRKIAAEQGIDASTVQHSGDRVTKADLLQNVADKLPKSVPPSAVESTPALAQPIFSYSSPTAATAPVSQTNQPGSQPRGDLPKRPEERVPMTRLRKRVAERLLNAQHEHAILTTFNEINMKAVMELRNQYKVAFEKKHGIKLGFMSFFAKAVVAALQQFPVVNASSEGDDIIYHGYYDIGVAVSTQRGLVVPILRDVDTLSFADVEKGIADFGRRARDAQLSLEELTGGTFTITNGGIFGSMLSTPILNPPQSAILGMHNIVERPVAENGQVVIRPVMYVALSYDHRLIDGRDAVQFLVTVKNTIEEPSRLLLDI
jgi:2-oxoglutarate dehydrogenase E2 component (dihydrolipoamide succinyltransferase)